MLFTWDTTNLCIVFRGWRIDGTGSLIFSLLAIVLLTAGYEAVREISRRYEAHERNVLEGRRGGGDTFRGESASHTSQRHNMEDSSILCDAGLERYTLLQELPKVQGDTR